METERESRRSSMRDEGTTGGAGGVRRVAVAAEAWTGRREAARLARVTSVTCG